MENISFNKLRQTAVCFMCKENRVPLAFWNKPCEECKKKLKTAVTTTPVRRIEKLKLANQLPAAIIEKGATRLEPKEDVYVDKYGRKVDNPGYDPVNDPRGWNATGAINRKPGQGAMIY